MLILSRKKGGVLRIGDDITLTVLSVAGNGVRLGIDAPPEISVHREEIYRKLKGIASVQDSTPPQKQ